MQTATLRIIDDGPRDAVFNMAADLYLLECCATSPAIHIRFYQWQPPAISIGYMQDPTDLLNMDACRRDGIEWVRRPTGGRAVLHQEDLTYSCTFSKKIRSMGSGIAETYHRISDCLIRGLSRSGITCAPSASTLDSAGVRREIKLPCFLAPNRREIMAGGRKLAGSAQKRTNDGVLQHGSIPLTPAFRKLPLYENISRVQQTLHMALLEKKCACIGEVAPDLAVETLRDGLIRGFAETLGLDAVTGPWSDSELREIESLAVSSGFRRRWRS